MKDFFNAIFSKSEPAAPVQDPCEEREKLTKEEVMQHFDCQRFQGPQSTGGDSKAT